MKQWTVLFLALVTLTIKCAAQIGGGGGGGSGGSGSGSGSFLATQSISVATNGNDTTGSIGGTPYATIGAACRAATSGCFIKIFPGTYDQTPVFVLPDATTMTGCPIVLSNKANITISGFGARITGSGSRCHMALYNTTNIVIAGLDFDLTKGTGAEITNTYQGVIQLMGVTEDTTFSKVKIRNATDQGITTDRLCYGLTVQDSYFSNIGSTNVTYVLSAVPAPFVDGTPISGCGTDTKIINCEFNFCHRGVEWDDYVGFPYTHSSLLVQGCTFTNMLHYCVGTYTQNTNSFNLNRIIITGNSMHMRTNAPEAIDSTWGALQEQAAIWLDTGQNITVANNTIRSGINWGIKLESAGPLENYAITGNALYGRTNVPSIGIVVQSTKNNASRPYQIINGNISLNNLSHYGRAAIFASGANTTILGNTAWNCGMEDTSQRYIYFSAANTTYRNSNIVWIANTTSDSKAANTVYMFGVETNVLRNKFFSSNNGENLLGLIASAQVSQTYYDGYGGQATLVNGNVVVAHTLVHANSRILLSRQTTGGTAGHLYVTTNTLGTSFTITSSSATDTSVINWRVDEGF